MIDMSDVPKFFPPADAAAAPPAAPAVDAPPADAASTGDAAAPGAGAATKVTDAGVATDAAPVAAPDASIDALADALNQVQVADITVEEGKLTLALARCCRVLLYIRARLAHR
jgi:hypothetical protein